MKECRAVGSTAFGQALESVLTRSGSGLKKLFKELMQLLKLGTVVMALLVPEKREVIRVKSTCVRHSPPCLALAGNLSQLGNMNRLSVPRYIPPDIEQWLQRHPEASPSWPSWRKDSHSHTSKIGVDGWRVGRVFSSSPLHSSRRCRGTAPP